MTHEGRGEEDHDGLKSKIFISYSRKDTVFADRIELALKRCGFQPLIDRSGISDLEDWRKRVGDLITQADTIVFVLSPDSIHSTECKKEIDHAVSINKRFAPVLWRMVEDSAVPEALARINRINFVDAAFDDSMDRLIHALSTDIGWVRKHTQFGEAALRWAEAARPRGLLLRPPVLDEAERWIATRPHGAPEATGLTQSLIVESRKAETAARALRRRVKTLILVLAVCIIAGFIGWMYQSQIREQWRWHVTINPFMRAQIRPYVLTAAAEHALKPKDPFQECAEEQGNHICPEMIVIPAGAFVMGSPQNEKGRIGNEGPQHRVTIAYPFAVSRFEVTVDEWDTCVTYGDCAVIDPKFGRGLQPAVDMTWDDAQKYVAWLSRMTGKPYRLLSESEYEYATRAGTTTAYPWGNDPGKGNANCFDCGSKWDNLQPAPVGSFNLNRFNLFDMVGNVWEWVEDCAHENFIGAPADGSAWIEGGSCKLRMVRGGCWTCTRDQLRSAKRAWVVPTNHAQYVGFRVARSLAP